MVSACASWRQVVESSGHSKSFPAGALRPGPSKASHGASRRARHDHPNRPDPRAPPGTTMREVGTTRAAPFHAALPTTLPLPVLPPSPPE
jgi:hypothetical protein